MKKKLLAICLIAILAVTSLGLVSTTQKPVKDVVKSVQSLSMFSVSKWTTHYRTPNVDQIATLLEEQGVPLSKLTPEAKDQAVKTFQQEWAKRNPTTPNPQKLQKLLNNEISGKLDNQTASAGVTTPQIMSLAVPVEFPNSDIISWCGDPAATFTGPLHNEILPPGPRDNNTIWYDNATPALYNSLYFGVGPNAGVIVHHPTLGTLDFRGNTMANYYLEQSEGKFVPKGEVYPKWLQAAHSEAWYGQDSCDASNHNVNAGVLVEETVNAINADNPSFAWQNYDGDGDGVVDNFTVIHAGQGQEAGGGVQGAFAIWSHASSIDYPDGKLACAKGATGCPDRNIYVREYSMDPENLDVGVISEEFGHAAFGLPDIYTTDAQASPSNWIIMEAGSWNGKLGGMTPAPFPLYFRYLVGWANPVVLDYSTGPKQVKVGQLSLRPEGTQQGIKINLPPTEIVTPNPLNGVHSWWSDVADGTNNYLDHNFAPLPATPPAPSPLIFSFASYWSIEQDFDYGYFEVSTNGGTTWDMLKDMDGKFTDANPNGNNLGWGLTGEGTGTLRFDLTAYRGQSITVRLRYVTDPGVQWAGWFGDDFQLVNDTTQIWADDVEGDTSAWSTNAWKVVPLTKSYPMYYLAEWRNNSGFDKGLSTPYTTIYSNENTNEWQVDRCPYTVPGMLLWLRNAAQPFDYTLTDSLFDSPSYGPKHALLVVDSHYWPLLWNGLGSSGVGLRLNSRCQPGNATFTLQNTKPFTARRSDAAGTILETKTFAPLPPVSQFHDALGYYPGLRYDDQITDGVYFWDAVASAVIPTTGDYTTKITLNDKTPFTDAYGYPFEWYSGGPFTILGTGDPRDSGVQYGVNIAVTGKANDGSWGKLVVWNSKNLGSLKMKASSAVIKPGQYITYKIQVHNTSPASQPFTLEDRIPKGTTYYKGLYFKASTNSIKWTGTLQPNETKVIEFWVRVNKDTPPGVSLGNTAILSDDANGAEASVSVLVK